MISKKKICLILMVMTLSTCNIAGAEEKVFEDYQLPAGQENVKANRETLENAQDAMKNKDFESAIALLTAYINDKPKRYEAYKLRGECFYALRQYQLAQKDFQSAIDIKADDDKFMTGTKYISAVILGADKQEQLQNPELGNLYGGLMYAQKALNNPAYEASYEEAVKLNTHIYLPKPKKDDITKINCPQKYGKKLNPQGIDAEIMSVIEDIEAGKFHEAMYKIPSITSNYPKYYLGYYLSGVVLSGMEQTEDAINAFKTALKYNPYDFESLASLGELYYSRAEKTFSSDDAAKSTEYFKKALKYNPNCNTYYFYIGLNDLLMKNYQSAIGNFNSAIKEKSNDYNSMYYKTVAHYMNGDYKQTDEDATKLLYRHVSNYNSVLYLRALAKYKQGQWENALMDIEKVHNNMNDIYNADIKPLSDKEKTLTTYLYYLKSEILKSKGMGTKADLEKAVVNPVIAKFVSGGSEMVLTPLEIDNQFDYIRTTFSDYDINYEYLNPDYKLSAVKKSLPASENIASSDKPEGISYDISEDVKPSLAQFLASQSLPTFQNKQPEAVTIDDVISNTKIEQNAESQADIKTAALPEASAEIEPEKISDGYKQQAASVPETEKTFVPEVITAENEPKEVVSTPEPIVNEYFADNNSGIEKIPSEPESAEQIAQNTPQPIIIEAAEKRETDDFQIRYEASKVQHQPEAARDITETVSEKTVMEKEHLENVIAEKPVEKIIEVSPSPSMEETKIVEEIPPQKSVSNIVEKRANVDLSEFAVPKQKAMPEIKDTDEVIVFEPQNIFNRQEPVVESAYNDLANKLANKLSKFVPEQDIVEANSEAETRIATETEPEIIQPEAIQVPESVKKAETRVKEPALSVPEYTVTTQKPINETETVVADTLETSPLDELAQMLSDVAELEKQQRQDTVEAEASNEVCEIKELDEKPVKEKRRWFRKRVKPAEEIIPEPQIIQAEKNQPENTEDEQETDGEGSAAISSILQTVFNGENQEKSKVKTETELEPEKTVVQDENLERLDEVQPLDVEEVEKIEDVQEPEAKPVKEKRRWFSKRVKPAKDEAVEVPENSINLESEQPELKDLPKEDGLSENKENPEAPVSEIKPEEKPQKFGWFKRLFKKKQKSEVREVEPVVQLEPELQDAINEAAPQIRTEKADIQSEEIDVSEVQSKPAKKKFNWFKRKQKVSKSEEIIIDPEPEIIDEPVKPVKKIIKQTAR